MWQSLREYTSAVVRKWWAIIGIAIEVLGLISGVLGTTILLPYWAWLIIGLIALMVAQFLIYYGVRKQRDPVESAISELESAIVSLDGQSISMATLFWKLGRHFSRGIHPDNICSVIRTILQTANSDECDKVELKLRSLQLIHDEPRLHGIKGYTLTVATPLGHSIINELVKKWGYSPWPPSAV